MAWPDFSRHRREVDAVVKFQRLEKVHTVLLGAACIGWFGMFKDILVTFGDGRDPSEAFTMNRYWFLTTCAITTYLILACWRERDARYRIATYRSISRAVHDLSDLIPSQHHEIAAERLLHLTEVFYPPTSSGTPFCDFKLGDQGTDYPQSSERRDAFASCYDQVKEEAVAKKRREIRDNSGA